MESGEISEAGEIIDAPGSYDNSEQHTNKNEVSNLVHSIEILRNKYCIRLIIN